jgi:PWWP domain
MHSAKARNTSLTWSLSHAFRSQVQTPSKKLKTSSGAKVAAAQPASPPSPAVNYDKAALDAVSSKYGDLVWARLTAKAEPWPALIVDPRFTRGDLQSKAFAALKRQYLVLFYGEQTAYGLVPIRYSR